MGRVNWGLAKWRHKVAAILRTCIVCGAKSHRLDWQQAQYPACDSHSKAEVQAAIVKASTPAASQAAKAS